ncbi:MAG: hypothetical protein AB9915_03720 [Candidatus Dojkabacteria bacterium]
MPDGLDPREVNTGSETEVDPIVRTLDGMSEIVCQEFVNRSRHRDIRESSALTYQMVNDLCRPVGFTPKLASGVEVHAFGQIGSVEPEFTFIGDSPFPSAIVITMNLYPTELGLLGLGSVRDLKRKDLEKLCLGKNYSLFKPLLDPFFVLNFRVNLGFHEEIDQDLLLLWYKIRLWQDQNQ